MENSNNDKIPVFNGAYPVREMYLDKDTFIVYFSTRDRQIKDSDGRNVFVTSELFAEVHIDENNRVIIGESIYEKESGDFIDTNYYGDDSDGHTTIEGMTDIVANKIAEYTLQALKNSTL